MRFTINKTVLLRELDAVLGAIEKKSTIPILANIKLHTEGDELVIRATDLDLSTTCRVMADVKTKGAICLPAVKLAAIIKSLADGEVEFNQKNPDEFKVEIKSGRSKFNLSGYSVENYPEIESSAVEFYSLPSGAFAEMMRRGRIAITKEDSRYTLNGVKLEIENGTVRIISTDGHRLSISERQAKGFDGVNFAEIVPTKAVNECVRLADMDTTVGIGFDEKLIYFRFGNRVMSARKLAGQFPNWPLIVPKKTPKATITVAASELLTLIQRVALLAGDNTATIILDLSENQLAVLTRDSDIGNSFDSIAIDYDGEPFKMAFNSTYLIEYLAALNGQNVDIEFRSLDSQLVIRLKTEDKTESAFGIVMPLRL